MAAKRDAKEQVYFSKRQHEQLLSVTDTLAEDRSAFIRRIVMAEVERFLAEQEKEFLKLHVLRSMSTGTELPDGALGGFAQLRDAS